MRTYLLNREYVVDAGVELGVALEDVGVDTGQGAWRGREAVSEGRRRRQLSVMVMVVQGDGGVSEGGGT